jgi:hypothetical protein
VPGAPGARVLRAPNASDPPLDPRLDPRMYRAAMIVLALSGLAVPAVVILGALVLLAILLRSV